MSSQPAEAKSTSSQPATQTSTSTSTKTPATLHPTAHLADGAYVKGVHPITIGANTLVHPRAYILSIHAPLTINTNTLILPKAIIGAPLPTSTSTNGTTDPTPSLPPLTPSTPPTPTIIGSHVQIHPHATIHHSTTIADSSIVESHATLLPGAHIGPHSKICSGITISSTIPAWTVVYGNGERRRLRKTLSSTHANAQANARSEAVNAFNDGLGETATHTATESSLRKPEPYATTATVDIDLPETQRLHSLNKEREAATTILRNNAKYLNVARQKAQQREGGREEKVR